jgi:hypothetical protein
MHQFLEDITQHPRSHSMKPETKLKIKTTLVNLLGMTKTRDPIPALMTKIFKTHFLLAAITMGVLTVGLWIGVSNVIEHYYPGRADVFFYDPDEFTFGLFLWGFFIPVMWWYYLSSPSSWKRTVNALQEKGLVDRELIHIIPEKSFTVLSVLLAIMVGLLYRFNSIPTEIALGRMSFWFVTPWSMLLICLVVSVNAYVLINFLLDTILLSYRMATFFNSRGICSLVIFHVDGCGGFGTIGSMAMRMSSLAVLAGLWAVWYSLLPKFFGAAPNLGLNVWLIYGVYIILAPLLLLTLTWPVHKAMRKYKINYKERVCNNLETTFHTLSNTAIEPPCNDPKVITENLDQYKRLIQVLERVDSIPEWPILLSNFKKFTGFASLPGIIGFVSFVFDVIDFSKFLK